MDAEDLRRLQAEAERWRGRLDEADDEEVGYVQGLEDALRILQGLPPEFRAESDR